MSTKTISTFVAVLFISSLLSAQVNIDYSKIKEKMSLPEGLEISLNHFFEKFNADDIAENNKVHNNELFSQTIFEEVIYQETAGIDSLTHITRTVLNTYPITGDRHLIQIGSYVQSVSDKALQVLWTIIAHQSNSGYTFRSPLAYNTYHWNNQDVNGINYHFRDKINIVRANSFSQNNAMMAQKFNVPMQSFDFYMASSFQEIMNLVGINYCKNIIGKTRDGWGVVADKYIFSIMNNEDFSHDIFHYYSGTLHERPMRNWVTEEGVAYSWGNAYYSNVHTHEMTNQDELVRILKDYLVEHPNQDLYKLFTDAFWNDRSTIYDHIAPDYKTGRVISSLICDAVESKLGMAGLNQLITCGNEPDRFSAFFKATEALIGLNIDNFNATVYKLIENYNK